MTKRASGAARAVLAAGLLAALALGAGQGLTGSLTRDEILKARPDWAAVMEAYRPRPDVLDRIRTFVKPLAVEIFFGLDSADSRDLVARFFRLYESLDPGLVSVKYVSVSPDLKSPLADIQARIVESVPTLLVQVDDYELGRIIVAPAGQPRGRHRSHPHGLCRPRVHRLQRSRVPARDQAQHPAHPLHALPPGRAKPGPDVSWGRAISPSS